MGRKIAIGVLLIIAVLIALAFFLRKEPPPIPPDADHLRTRGDDRACLVACHSPGQKKPRGPKHPLADDCSRCHAFR